MNLLEETIDDIKQSGHTPEDIMFIGSESTGHRCTWTEFQTLANVEYDAGFGAQEVASDLIIVFSDGARMWRHGYDGSEHWAYSYPFKMPTESHPITYLTVTGSDRVGWCDLAELNTPTSTGESDG
jgi:hypothetical protein